MEDLKFSCATIPKFNLMDSEPDFVKGKLFSDSFWAMTLDSQCYVLTTKGHSLIPEVNKDYEIVPMLVMSNYHDSAFSLGETFTIKGLPFVVISPVYALCTQSIGTYAQCTEEDHCLLFEYKGSELEEILNDWFEAFFKGVSVSAPPKADDASTTSSGLKIYSVFDVYKIERMPGTYGRWQISNYDGTVRHNASGHGFKSESSAYRMLKGYASRVPIPQEDIDAYEKHLKEDFPFEI